MKEQDFDQLFQDRKHQLDRMPSPRAWHQLERRLDSHRKRNKFHFARSLSMAAALLLIIVLSIGIALSVPGEQPRLLNQSPLPLASEQLEADDVEAAEELRLAISAQQAEAKRNRLIEDNKERGKRLLASHARTEPGKPSIWQTLLNRTWSLPHGQEGALRLTQGPDATAKGASSIAGLPDFKLKPGSKSKIDMVLELASNGADETYALVYQSPQLAVFEQASGQGRGRISFELLEQNRLAIIWEKADRKALHPVPRQLTPKPQQWMLHQLQLQ